MTVQILKLNFVVQPLMPLPEIILHFGIHIMNFRIAAFAQILQRLTVCVLNTLQFIRQRGMLFEQMELPQYREIGEVCLGLACIQIIQAVQHRPQLVQQ
ncbi:hypothetical protein D3C72_2120840 [compost metagenome]